MSTTVVLEVTPLVAVDADRFVRPPAEVTRVLHAAGQDDGCGLSCRGSGPWRYHFPLTGRDRATAGQALLEEFRRLGYDADLSVGR